MCRDCGCSITDGGKQSEHERIADSKTLEVLTKILDANDRQASSNRQHLDRYGILGINLMSSPGAGKTTLLERTIDALKGRLRVGVIEGDLETERDAERVRSKGVPAYQITTGQACHLDASMVHKALHHLPLEDIDVLFIENVGNLVCPAVYDLGAHINVVLLSTTEGDDKPEKYPVMFKSAKLMLITKIDLLEYMDFDLERAVASARKVNPKLDIIKLSAKTGEGVERWIEFISEKHSKTPSVREEVR